MGFMPCNRKKQNVVLFVYLAMAHSDYEISSMTYYGMKRLPQLGIQYLSSVMKQRGIHVDLLDQTIESFNSRLLVDRLTKKDYDFVGFHSATALKGKIIEYIRMVRDCGIDTPIIIGGPGHFGSEDYLRSGADVVCHGEGERTILEIMDYLNQELPLDRVKGISYVQDGRVCRSLPQPLITELDSIPFPDRTLYPIEKYYDFRIFGMRTPYATMIASRGCKFRCTYCSAHRHWNNLYRLRSVSNVIQEIGELIAKYDIRYIGFKDDSFGADELWLQDFLRIMIEKKYPIKWSCLIHPLIFKKDCGRKVKLFKHAGCDFLSLGLQSVDPGILRAIGRSPEEPKVLSSFLKEAKKNDITILYEFILGLPGETIQTIKNNVTYVFKNRPHYVQFYTLAKLEGSQIYDNYRDKSTCDIADQELKKYCIKSMKLFYTNPLVIIYDFCHILRKNPRWLIKTLRYLIYLLNATGIIMRGKKKTQSGVKR